MTGPDVVKSSSGLTLAVALHEGLGENLATVGAIDGRSNLILCRIRLDNSVLSGNLGLGLPSKIGINLLVLADSVLQAAVDSLDLPCVHTLAGSGVRLDLSNSVDQGSVKCHGIR